MHDVVALEGDAVAVGRVLDELELGLVALGEEPLAAAEQQREDEQVVAVDEAGLRRAPGRARALPWTWISPPSVSLSAATSSRDRRTCTVPSPHGAVSPASVVETTYLGIAL